MKLHGKRTKQALAFYLERQKLRQEIEQTRHSIDSARNHFEQVVDPTLIDCYIYELNAAQLRYQFLLRRFKSLEPESTYNLSVSDWTEYDAGIYAAPDPAGYPDVCGNL